MPVPRETLGPSRAIDTLLHDHVDLILRWNDTVRLISARDVGDIWTRHVEDCLQLACLIPTGTSEAVDIGSGAGFPGLVLAITTGIRFHLIESDQRKAGFLREATRLTGAPVVVHCCRSENTRLAPMSLVTARAVAPLRTLLGLAAPLLAPAGTCLFPKGESVDNELADAGREWHMNVRRWPSRTAATSTILTVTGIQRRT